MDEISVNGDGARLVVGARGGLVIAVSPVGSARVEECALVKRIFIANREGIAVEV